jgi:hypothetical protein
MRRGDEKRFARLETHLPPDPAQQQRSRRRRLRLLVTWGWLIHDMAAAAGVDPETIAALRDAEAAAAELGALGDGAELAAAETAAAESQEKSPISRPGEPDARGELLRRWQRIGASYADGARPSPDAPFMTWLGWAMAQPPVSRQRLEKLHADASARRLAAADAATSAATSIEL